MKYVFYLIFTVFWIATLSIGYGLFKYIDYITHNEVKYTVEVVDVIGDKDGGKFLVKEIRYDKELVNTYKEFSKDSSVSVGQVTTHTSKYQIQYKNVVIGFLFAMYIFFAVLVYVSINIFKECIHGKAG